MHMLVRCVLFSLKIYVKDVIMNLFSADCYSRKSRNVHYFREIGELFFLFFFYLCGFRGTPSTVNHGNQGPPS